MSPLRSAVAMAGAIALGLAAAAQAQVGIKIETIERIGDWDAVAANGTLFVSATPSSRAARAFCLSSYLKVAYDDMPNPVAGAEAESIGAAPGYGCMIVACNSGAAARGANAKATKAERAAVVSLRASLG